MLNKRGKKTDERWNGEGKKEKMDEEEEVKGREESVGGWEFIIVDSDCTALCGNYLHIVYRRDVEFTVSLGGVGR